MKKEKKKKTTPKNVPKISLKLSWIRKKIKKIELTEEGGADGISISFVKKQKSKLKFEDFLFLCKAYNCHSKNKIKNQRDLF